MEFFESLGFACPEHKGIADFLQEVTSRKDQKVCSRPLHTLHHHACTDSSQHHVNCKHKATFKKFDTSSSDHFARFMSPQPCAHCQQDLLQPSVC